MPRTGQDTSMTQPVPGATPRGRHGPGSMPPSTVVSRSTSRPREARAVTVLIEVASAAT